MMTSTAPTLAPGLDDIADMARTAIASLPPEFRIHAKTVVLRVEDFAPDEMLDDLGVEDPFELTGVYDGTPLIEKSVMDQPERPDTIWLFRRPILDEWIGRGDVDLAALVTHVYVHELAHHMGWSDEDIATIDRWWE
jgi:predicted Zn-dependent protease with MMP-like domain